MPRSPSAVHAKAGQPWSESDDRRLVECWKVYGSGRGGIKALSDTLGRSIGAIQSRLSRHGIEWWLPEHTLTLKQEPTNMNSPIWTDEDQRLMEGLIARKQVAETHAAIEREKRFSALSTLLIQGLCPDSTDKPLTVDAVIGLLLANANGVIAALGPQAALQSVGIETTPLAKGHAGPVNRSSAIARIHRSMNSPSGSYSYAAAGRALDAMIDLGLVTNYARAQNQ